MLVHKGEQGMSEPGGGREKSAAGAGAACAKALGRTGRGVSQGHLKVRGAGVQAE